MFSQRSIMIGFIILIVGCLVMYGCSSTSIKEGFGLKGAVVRGNIITYKGNDYQTITGQNPIPQNPCSTGRCENSNQQLIPEGWQIADGSAESKDIAASYPWGAEGLVFLGGNSVYTATSIIENGGNCGAAHPSYRANCSPFCPGDEWHSSGQLTTDGPPASPGTHAWVTSCDQFLLLSRPTSSSNTYPTYAPGYNMLPGAAVSGDIVSYNGKDYQTLTGLDPYGVNSNCESTDHAVPDGWGLAADTDDAASVITAFPWSSKKAVVINGSQYQTAPCGDTDTTGAGRQSSCRTLASGSGALLPSYKDGGKLSSVKVSSKYCDSVVLLSRQSAGGGNNNDGGGGNPSPRVFISGHLIGSHNDHTMHLWTPYASGIAGGTINGPTKITNTAASPAFQNAQNNTFNSILIDKDTTFTMYSGENGTGKSWTRTGPILLWGGDNLMATWKNDWVQIGGSTTVGDQTAWNGKLDTSFYKDSTLPEGCMLELMGEWCCISSGGSFQISTPQGGSGTKCPNLSGSWCVGENACEDDLYTGEITQKNCNFTVTTTPETWWVPGHGTVTNDKITMINNKGGVNTAPLSGDPVNSFTWVQGSGGDNYWTRKSPPPPQNACVPGLDVTSNGYSESSIEACQQSCQEDSNCTWWSYYPQYVNGRSTSGAGQPGAIGDCWTSSSSATTAAQVVSDGDGFSGRWYSIGGSKNCAPLGASTSPPPPQGCGNNCCTDGGNGNSCCRNCNTTCGNEDCNYYGTGGGGNRGGNGGWQNNDGELSVGQGAVYVNVDGNSYEECYGNSCCSIYGGCCQACNTWCDGYWCGNYNNNPTGFSSIDLGDDSVYVNVAN